jgi:hypothetical protein
MLMIMDGVPSLLAPQPFVHITSITHLLLLFPAAQHEYAVFWHIPAGHLPQRALGQTQITTGNPTIFPASNNKIFSSYPNCSFSPFLFSNSRGHQLPPFPQLHPHKIICQKQAKHQVAHKCLLSSMRWSH